MSSFIDKNKLLTTLCNKKSPIEINLSLWEDEYSVWIAICLIYGNKLGEQDYIHINKIPKDDFYEKLEAYKKEAYQIKRLVKKKFPTVKVSSSFSWT